MSYQHKRSSVAGKVPTPADFKPGQIIVNITDGKLYMLVGTTVKSFSMDEAISLLLDGKQDKLDYTPLNKAGDTAVNLKTSTTPTDNDHVARKDYVDSKVANIKVVFNYQDIGSFCTASVSGRFGVISSGDTRAGSAFRSSNISTTSFVIVTTQSLVGTWRNMSATINADNKDASSANILLHRIG